MNPQLYQDKKIPGVDVIRALPATSLFNDNWHQTICKGGWVLLAALLILCVALMGGRSPSRDLGVLEAKGKMGGGGKASLMKSGSHKASGEGA